jgi:hypothetical protein
MCLVLEKGKIWTMRTHGAQSAYEDGVYAPDNRKLVATNL